jgi:HK97 gp10 family phage protein
MPDIKTGFIQTTGFADLERQLLQFPDAVKKTLLGAALAAGARVIQVEAKQQCPESAESHWIGKKGGNGRTMVQPGELKKKGIRVRQRREQPSANLLTYIVYVSKHYWYWKFVEFGHVIAQKPRTRAERKTLAENWKGGYVAAKPFMRPAFESQKQAAVQVVGEYLKARIAVASDGGKWVSMKQYLKLSGA